MSWAKDTPRGVELSIIVVPRASRSRVMGVHDGRLKVQLAAPPVDGEANAALVELLAGLLGVRKSAISLIEGETSRRKRVLVEGAGAASVRVVIDGAS